MGLDPKGLSATAEALDRLRRATQTQTIDLSRAADPSSIVAAHVEAVAAAAKAAAPKLQPGAVPLDFPFARLDRLRLLRTRRSRRG